MKEVTKEAADAARERVFRTENMAEAKVGGCEALPEFRGSSLW